MLLQVFMVLLGFCVLHSRQDWKTRSRNVLILPAKQKVIFKARYVLPRFNKKTLHKMYGPEHRYFHVCLCGELLFAPIGFSVPSLALRFRV